MEENTKITPAEEVQTAPETTVQTIGDVLDTMPKETPKENSVPEHIFLEQKKARKEAEKRIKELEAMINDGATKKEVSSDIASIAKEYDIDPDFLDKFAKSVRSEATREVDERLSTTLGELEKKNNAEKIEKAFNTHFNLAIEAMPEFKDIVNPSVIKSLSMLPQNGNKTFSQLIEETYGNAITGKRTIQSTVPSGGKEPAPLDYNRANTDKEYFAQVMANPKLKEEYNKVMLHSGF